MAVVQGWEERREEGRDEEKDAPHLQFSTYFPGFVPAGIRSISTISRFGSSHANTFGLPEHLQTPGLLPSLMHSSDSLQTGLNDGPSRSQKLADLGMGVCRARRSAQAWRGI